MKPIIALDFSSKEETMNFLNLFNESLYVKVGMELFYKEGPTIIEDIKAQGHEIFLDLKLHDIPNTVEHAMYNLGRLGVTMTNVHAAGGSVMMAAALKGLKQGAQDAGYPVPILIAVTQLTSTTEVMMQHEQCILTSLNDSVCHYAQVAKKAGLDGVVCSAKEAKLIAKHVPGMMTVCPGVRLKQSDDDQRRVMTPQDARNEGATMIVVGRPITKANDPVAAYDKIKKEWGE